MSLNRADVERLPMAETMRMVIETAGPEDGVFRVVGRMNSFGVMRSRRLLHPAAFADWLAANPDATLPMLANHGYIGGGFATVGRWTSFKVDKSGMTWSGFIGGQNDDDSTELQRDARRLLAQKVLDGLSLGWEGSGRWANIDEPDLDPLVKGALKKANVKEAFVFYSWAPVEGSLVDVGDDPLARVARRGEAPDHVAESLSAIRAQLETFGDRFDSIEETIAAMGLTSGDLDDDLCGCAEADTDAGERDEGGLDVTPLTSRLRKRVAAK